MKIILSILLRFSLSRETDKKSYLKGLRELFLKKNLAIFTSYPKNFREEKGYLNFDICKKVKKKSYPNSNPWTEDR